MIVTFGWLFPRAKIKIETVTHSSNVSLLSYRCVSLTGEKSPTSAQGGDETCSHTPVPRESLPSFKCTLPGNFYYSNGKWLATWSLKCWRQQTILKYVDEVWYFSGRQLHINGTAGFQSYTVFSVPNTMVQVFCK